MSKLRVTFKKGENMRYTGHLDVLRTFSRVLRRFDFPLKYSEGFNPHPVMTFILPTGVGVTSDCEIVDVGITDNVNTEEFIKNFNSVSQKDSIVAVSAEITDEPMPTIVKANYVVKILNENKITAEEIKKSIELPEILIEKKSKKQTKEVNLKDFLFDYSVEVINEKEVFLNLTISAGNTSNLKPALFVEGLSKVCENLKPLYVLPHRTRYIFE
ncbi:MAG: DUF2344 domain-containing protein [Clostridia bacterium]|nr:DUF2344 domain-containing protein [Clostridia bacterium]